MKNRFLTLSIFLLLFCACKKESSNPFSSETDYLIFGHFYGFCQGDKCIELYKLDKTQLFEDMNDTYPNASDFYSGSYRLLSQDKFENSKDLLNYFPNELLSDTNTVIGTPDAGDWGGLYVEYNLNGVRKFWLIDMMKENVPAKYHAFMDEVNKRIALND